MNEAPRQELRLLAAQLRTIIGESPQGVAAPALLGAISAALVWQSAPRVPLVATLSCLFVTLAGWVLFYRHFKRVGIEDRDAERWARRAFWKTLAHGLCWGAYSLVAFPANPTYQSLLVAFMYGLVAGGVVVDGPHFKTFVAFAVPTLLPVVVRCFVEGTTVSIASGAAGLVGLGQSLFAALSSSRVNEQAILARFENEALLEEVEKQREQALEARSRAEAASREKSRFLAAASHDLRQPMHALRLFASAALGSKSDAERRQIVERIDASVGSLSALFDSLLEVSRLDAGALEPRLATVRLQALLGELVTEHASAAQQKGLALRLHARDLNVRTDAVLLGRLLRNLLSNALRYTDRGGVLVACRRRGNKARLEVWDTGVGIPADLQTLVFDEFFQIGNPERDRRNGVGLGLSIVARIAALLGYAVEVASRVGKGSRFAVELPLHDAPESEKATRKLPIDGALFGVLVVVLDDEPEILTAMSLWLRQYGCHVVAAESLEQAREQLQAEGATPELLITDYRLRNGKTGMSAARELRAEYGPELPVLLVTGDSSVDISGTGLKLLKKPVAREQLEQAMLELL
ncbi:MAG: His Kinase phosphoacceptor domain protein 1 [Polyangiaceae bacterium]|nr:His Kinase phosphoacceptor domain protein 1 [Polyangiaceae bacterium]